MAKYTYKKAHNAFEKMIKSAKKICSEKEFVHGIWTDKDGFQYVTDGHRIYRLGGFGQPEPLDGFPEVKDQEDIDAFMADIDKDFENGEFVQLEVPGVDEMKEYQKRRRSKDTTIAAPWFVHKESNTLIYDFGFGMPCINVQFLLDALEFLPDGKLYARRCKNSYNKPMLLKSYYGDAVLFPMVMSHKKK